MRDNVKFVCKVERANNGLKGLINGIVASDLLKIFRTET